MKSFLCSLLCLALAVQHTTARPVNVNANNNLIKETCKTSIQKDKNIEYDFCVTSLQASPEGRAAGDIGELGLVAFNLILKNVTAMKGRVKELLADKKVGHNVKVVLKICRGLYSDAVSSAKESIGEYKSKRYNDAKIHISAVSADSGICETTGYSPDEILTPLTKENTNTFQLTSLGLAILSLVSA